MKELNQRLRTQKEDYRDALVRLKQGEFAVQTILEEWISRLAERINKLEIEKARLLLEGIK